MNEIARSIPGDPPPGSPELGGAGVSGVDGVEMDRVRLIREPLLEESEPYRRMNDRLRASEALVASMPPRGPVATDLLLTAALDELVADGRIDGLLVGSEDGFVVAQSSGMGSADLLAVIGTVFDFVSRRVQAEGLMPRVDEMAARGAGGEQIVMRYFPGAASRFFLLAYSRQPATYRRTMARALKRCGDILEGRLAVRRTLRRAPGPGREAGKAGPGEVGGSGVESTSETRENPSVVPGAIVTAGAAPPATGEPPFHGS